MLKFQDEIVDMLVFGRNYCCSCRVIPLDTREEAIKLCSTEVLVSQCSAESLSEPEIIENISRRSKSDHSSSNFQDKEICYKGFNEVVKTSSSEVSPMARSGKCQWQHFGPGGVNPDPIPLYSETDGMAFCDVHNFVSPNISISAATSNCCIQPEHEDQICSKCAMFGDPTVRTSGLDDSFFPPNTNGKGSSLNSSELNLRLKEINQESDDCSSS